MSKRPDVALKLGGAAIYGADLTMDGMLWAALARSSVPHAKVVSVDIDPAFAVDGVTDVITARDLPSLIDTARADPRYVMLADHEVRYDGEPLAIVVATSRRAAYAGASAIRIRYEALPAFTELGATFPHWPVAGEFPPGVEAFRHVHARSAPFDTVAREADRVIHERYVTSPVAQFHLEPRACLAWAQGERLYVDTSTQTIFGVREAACQALGLPLERVHVRVTWVGGSFGAKTEPTVETWALLAVLRTQRPVKLSLYFDEDLRTARSTQEGVFWMSTALTGSRVQAIRCRFLLSMGSGGNYPKTGEFVLSQSISMALGPYRWENWEVEGYAVRTNLPPWGPFRGTLSPQFCFARESHLDGVARACDSPPIEFRLAHVLCAGDTTALGNRVGPFPLRAMLTRTSEVWRAWQNGPMEFQGIGLAAGSWSMRPSRGGEVRLCLRPSSLVLQQSNYDVGSGSIVRGLLTIVSERTGLEPDSIALEYPDTSSAPFDHGVGALM